MTLQNKYFLSFFVVLSFMVVSTLYAFELSKWKKHEVLSWDMWGYHNYLPATIIYKDLKHMAYIDSVEKIYNPTGGAMTRYGLYPAPVTHNLCNQYPCGVAIFQLPFFLVAHSWCLITHQYVADGYSSPYQHATVLSTLFFVLLGLFILILFLKRYFKDYQIAIALLILCFGTNLFQYTAVEQGLSHPYLFFLYCCILFLTDKWYTQAKYSYSVLLGLCIGLCAITRPIDVLVFLAPLFWSTQYKNSEMTKWKYIIANKDKVILTVIICFITCLPQLIYWKELTGQWVYFSYEHDFFEFKRFRVLHGLFGFRKGWFIYTPLALLGFIGIFLCRKKSGFQFYFAPFWIFFLPMIYLVFSWHDWFYGWGFSCRPLIDTLPLLAFPICLLGSYLFTKKGLFKALYMTIVLLLISLNLFQTWQYNNGIIHGSLMNQKYYWKVFGKTSVRDEDRKLLEEQAIIDYKNNW